MKKLLAVLLSLCLVVGMLPMMAFATDGESEEPPVSVETTEPPKDVEPEYTGEGSGVGDTPPAPDTKTEPEGNDTVDDFEAFKNAVNSNKEEIVLVADIVVSEDLKIGNTTIKSAGEETYRLGGGFTVTGTVKLENVTLGANVLVNGGKLEIGTGTTVDPTVELSSWSGGEITNLGNDYSKAVSATDTTGRVYFTNNVASMGKAYITRDDGVKVVYSTLQAAVEALGADGGNVYLVATTQEEFELPEGVTLITENGAEAPNVNTAPDPDEGDEGDEDEPKLVTVTVNVDPAWATVTFTAEDGKVYTVKNGEVELPTGTYKVAARAMGYGTYEGNRNIKGEASIGISLSADPVRVIPSSHGYVKVNKPLATEGEIVRIVVNPDSNYYLDDLTIKGVKSGDTYRFWRDKDESNVFYFRMPGENVTVDADFSAYPDEYRVYIASDIKHGDVSVDTRYAEEGDWVYITVDPDVGYRLYGLTVTRPSGNTVKVEHVRGNVFRFKMPGVRVTVDAEFIRTVTPFTDVHLSDWFYESVSYVYWNGLMEGVTSYEFAPNATTTRAMVVQILYRMAGSPRVTGGSPFGDVSAGAWYADAVIWAEANDIVNGVSATRFDPNAPVTREQLATMLYRYAQYRHYNTSAGANTNILSYYDANHISEYAFSALQWVCGEGIVDGTGNGYLSPQGQATRAQLAAMLMRFCTL